MHQKILIALLGSAFLFGCGDDTESQPSRPTCDALAEKCHDSADPEGIECHEFGHDEANTEEQCAAKETECLAICEGAGGSTSSSGGSGGTTASSGGAGGNASGGAGGN